MKWYVVKKTSGVYQMYACERKPDRVGSVVAEADSYADAHEKMVDFEMERFDATDRSEPN